MKVAITGRVPTTQELVQQGWNSIIFRMLVRDLTTVILHPERQIVCAPEPSDLIQNIVRGVAKTGKLANFPEHIETPDFLKEAEFIVYIGSTTDPEVDNLPRYPLCANWHGRPNHYVVIDEWVKLAKRLQEMEKQKRRK